MSDSNGRGPPLPRGILKNKQTEEVRYGQERNMMNLDYLGQSVTTSSWDNVLQRTAQGIKPDLTSGLDRSLRQKLNEFISRKGDLLFRPLASDEVPLSEDKGTHRSTQDHYAVVPSLDYFLHLDPVERRRYFFNSVQPGDIVIATLVTKTLPGLHLTLLCMEGGRGFILEDLDIKAFCPVSQMIPAVDPKNPNKIFAPGDLVRCEILKVTADTEKLITGMKGNALSPEMQHSYQLGLIFRSDLPQEFSLAIAEKNLRGGKKSTYEEMLINSLGFQNPNNIAHLASAMGILSNKCTLMTGLSGVFPLKEMGTELRRMQNGKWAHGHVAEGIRYFKSANFTEAFQCLNKALTIDTENVEGLVARGALYANKATYEKAIDDFESALRFNPGHFNARKYLAETLVAYGRFLEASGKVEEAVTSYSKCLATRPDHADAKDALWSLYARTEKLDPSKMPSAAAAKTLELKEKLKVLLHSDLADDVGTNAKSVGEEGKSAKQSKKIKKERKKRERDTSASDISSSSESESETESSSSDDDSRRGKRKKKSNKKRKSKKNSKKSSKRESLPLKVQKDPSLSPLSKRLDSGNNAYPGGSFELNESTYSQWGKRLSISKSVGSEQEVDSKKVLGKKEKKKSRKNKEKRRRKRRSSSSSSSESDSSEELSVDKKKSKKAVADKIPSLVPDPILPDLGDLEAKLSAYYSKVEQGKVESLIQPQQDNRRNNNIQVTVEQNVDKYQRGGEGIVYENIVRKIEVRQKEPNEHELGRERFERKKTSESRPEQFHEVAGDSRTGKIELRTDEYGNYIHPGHIVRTVVNDTPEQSRPKFEMKFRPHAPQPSTTSSASPAQTPEQKSELGSKWRIVGAPTREEAYTVMRLDGSAVVKAQLQEEVEQASRIAAQGLSKPPFGLDHSLPNPLSPDKKSSATSRGKEDARNYRGRKSSQSRSRSRSRSLGRHRGRSRSRSYSRGRSRSRSRYSRSRSRSRSRTPDYRRNHRDYGRNVYRGGGGRTRFFRGYRADRGSRRPYGPSRGYTSGLSKFMSSRMRNVFRNSSRSRSKSRGRDSRSRSASPRGKERRSRSKGKERHDSRSKDRERRRSRSTSPSRSSRSKPPESKKKDDSSKGKESEKEVKIVSDGTSTSSTQLEKTKNEQDSKAKETASSEIQIGTLTTTKAADVEELLDQRKAQKKEEMRERNPDFFRPV